MLSILTAAAVGAYLHSRISIGLPGPDCSALEVLVETKAIARDLRAAWAILSAVCTWAVATGRAAREYIECTIAPFLELNFGVNLPKVPALRLPHAADSLIDFDTTVTRVTKAAAKSAA